MATGSLQRRLRSVRRRSLMIGTASATVWGLAAAVVLLLGGVWLDLLWELSPQLRIGLLCAAGAVGVALVGVLLGITAQAARDKRLARRLDRVADSGGQILTGVELDNASAAQPTATQPTATPSTATLTSGMARLAVDRAAAVAGRVPIGKAIPAKPLGRSSIVLVLLSAMVGLLVLCLPGLARTQWNRFVDPFGDVPPFSRIHFEVTPGDVEVLYGNELDIYATPSDTAVEQVELVLRRDGRPDEVLPMFPEANGRWRAALAKVTEPAVYHVRSYRARSTSYRIGLITVPRIEQVRLRITPPAYTNLAAYEGPLPRDGVAGLPRTEVIVRATSNRPLSGGTITVTCADSPESPVEISMQPVSADSPEVVGRFEVAADGKFSVSVTDVAGQASQQTFTGSITLLADQRPFIRLLQPRKNSLATPEAALPVEVSAEDDYGISRVELFRSLNDSRPLPTDLGITDLGITDLDSTDLGTTAQALRRIGERLYLPLTEYGLQPGDVIKLFGRVEDNDPAGVKGSESAVVTVRIISQEEFERMVRVREGLNVLLSKYREARRRMEGLAEKLDELRKKLEDAPPEGLVKKETRQEMERLLEQLRKESEALRRLADHKLPFDMDNNLAPELQRLAKMTDEIADALEKLAAEKELLNDRLAAKLKEMADKLAGERRLFDDRAIAPLDHLAAIFPLIADQSRFVMLVLRQQDLADRLAALKGLDGEDDPALKTRMRDLEQEQSKLHAELGSLLDDLENHAEQLPEDPELDKLRETAREFVEAVRTSGASEAMAEAEAALTEFAGTEAHRKAQEAAEILKRFLKMCEGMSGQCQGCLVFQPSLSSCLGNTIAQLLGEMGLGTGMGGSGMGSGGMGGYSARRGGFGLYGGMPGMVGGGDNPYGDSNSNGGDSGNDFVTGAMSGGQNPDASTRLGSQDAAAAAGIGEGAIPVRYRRRVGQYFQRIAEELGER